MFKRLRGVAAVATLLVLAYAVLGAAPHSTRIAALHEDGAVEYAGALSFVLAAVLFFRLFRWLSRHRSPDASRVKPYVAMAMAGLFVFAAGEEISWGQRILGIATPEAMQDLNNQEEINLHNLSWSSFDEYRLFTLGWYPYLIGLPVLAEAWPRVRRLVAKVLPILPMTVWPFTALYLLNDAVAWVAGRSVRVRGPWATNPDFWRVELRESAFAVLTALIAYLWWRASTSADRTHVPDS